MDNFGLKDLVKRNKREGKFCSIIPLFCLFAHCKVPRLFSRSSTLNSAIKVKVIRRQVFPRRRYGDGVGEGGIPYRKESAEGRKCPFTLCLSRWVTVGRICSRHLAYNSHGTAGRTIKKIPPVTDTVTGGE